MASGHTNFEEQQEFLELSDDQKLLMIFLNGKETNGHVADVMRDVEELKSFRDKELKPWMKGVDNNFIAAGAVIGALIAIGPVVFWVLDKLIP